MHVSLHCNFVVFGYFLFGEAKESDLQRATPAILLLNIEY